MCGGRGGAGGESPIHRSIRATALLRDNPAWARLLQINPNAQFNPFGGGVNAERVFGRFGDPKKEADNPEFLRNPFLDAPNLNGRSSLRINLGDLPTTDSTTPPPVGSPAPRPPRPAPGPTIPRRRQPGGITVGGGPTP